MIWFRKDLTLDDFNKRSRGSMVDHLGIEYLEMGPDYFKGRMPVDHRTKQPLGLLHGGASVVLAESLASMSGNFCVDPAKYYCVGLEINANHLKSVTQGYVTCVARPIHIGKRTQVWEMKIDQDGTPVCISRMTLAVLEKQPPTVRP
jgi:1,4-dihydroxy-2-naphthoyl-CoA hydrolase